MGNQKRRCVETRSGRDVAVRGVTLSSTGPAVFVSPKLAAFRFAAGVTIFIYFLVGAGLLEGGLSGAAAVAASSLLTAGGILSAFFTSTLTCQICVSVR
jgi:hypothetical protein